MGKLEDNSLRAHQLIGSNTYGTFFICSPVITWTYNTIIIIKKREENPSVNISPEISIGML